MTCACGCGKTIGPRSRVARGHNQRVHVPPPSCPDCACGCGMRVRSYRATYRQEHQPEPPVDAGRRAWHERDKVPAAPVLDLYRNRYGKDAGRMIEWALGVKPYSARCYFRRERIRRATAETLLRFAAELPRLPTKNQQDLTRRYIDRDRKRRTREAVA